jgi:hypothetical protein
LLLLCKTSSIQRYLTCIFGDDFDGFLVWCWWVSGVLLVWPQLLADMAAAERSASEALQTERSRVQALQQQLAELTATAAEQQRSLQAQLVDLGQQLAGKAEEVERLGGQLVQAQEGVASRDADLARLLGELSQVWGYESMRHRCCKDAGVVVCPL